MNIGRRKASAMALDVVIIWTMMFIMDWWVIEPLFEQLGYQDPESDPVRMGSMLAGALFPFAAWVFFRGKTPAMELLGLSLAKRNSPDPIVSGLYAFARLFMASHGIVYFCLGLVFLRLAEVIMIYKSGMTGSAWWWACLPLVILTPFIWAVVLSQGFGRSDTNLIDAFFGTRFADKDNPHEIPSSAYTLGQLKFFAAATDALSSPVQTHCRRVNRA